MIKPKLDDLVLVAYFDQPELMPNRYDSPGPKLLSPIFYHLARIIKVGVKYLHLEYLEEGNIPNPYRETQFQKDENGLYVSAKLPLAPRLTICLQTFDFQDYVTSTCLMNKHIAEHNGYENRLYSLTNISFPHVLGYWTNDRIEDLNKLENAIFQVDELTRKFKGESNAG